MQLLPELLSDLRCVCSDFPDPRKGRAGNIATGDFGMSAFALFFMQSPSFLAFQRRIETGQHRSNCQTLFGISRIPSDNYIRDMVDEAAPERLQPCFTRLEDLLKHEPMRKAFGRLGDKTLIALDGTEYFVSQKLQCPHCSTRLRNNGKSEHYHAMLAASVVAPGHSKVVPLMPEFIVKQDGAEKQDCERGAVKRWLDKHGERLKALNPVFLGDDIFACQPVAQKIRDIGGDFLFTAKEASHKGLYDFISGAKAKRHEVSIKKPGKKSETWRFRWLQDAPLRDTKDALHVTWLSAEILDASGKRKYASSWVTSLNVTKDNVMEVTACARARWKIENETFNVMKNNGYELEHNFGHGQKFLAMTLATMNMLAFAWHTILDLMEPPWKAAREKAQVRTAFFQNLISATNFAIFPTWHDLIKAITVFLIPPEFLLQKTEI
jgi:hypothetical protein